MAKYLLILLLLPTTAKARDYVYYGSWVTTEGKQLYGDMTCVLTPTGNQKYNGRFHGIWQQVPFDYTVEITGPIDKLQGQALIDGASYGWAGWVTKDQMKANFTGSRYGGNFDLTRNRAAESIPQGGGSVRSRTIPQTRKHTN